jgi:hypothetical protein
MKVVPRQQTHMEMKILLRSQGYILVYRHKVISGLMEGKKEVISRSLKLTCSMVMLGGQHISWRVIDVGHPCRCRPELSWIRSQPVGMWQR